MSFWRNTKIKRTRKKHRCMFCSRVIKIGDPAEYNAGIWEGDFQSYYFCDRCRKFIEKYNTELSDGFSGGDFTEYISGFGLDCCPVCGSNNHREYTWAGDMMSCKYECDNCDHIWDADYSMEDTVLEVRE